MPCPWASSGTSPAAQQAVTGLQEEQPGGFEFRLYPDESSARTALRDRDVDAFMVSPAGITVLDAGRAIEMNNVASG